MEDERIDMLERMLGELVALIREETRRQRDEQLLSSPQPSALPGANSLLPREEAWARLVLACRGGYTEEDLLELDVGSLKTVSDSVGMGSPEDLSKVGAQRAWLRQQRRYAGRAPHPQPFRVEPIHASPKLAVKAKPMVHRNTPPSSSNPNDTPCKSETTPRKASLLRPNPVVYSDPNEIASRTPNLRAQRRLVASPAAKGDTHEGRLRVRGEYRPPDPKPTGVRILNRHVGSLVLN